MPDKKQTKEQIKQPDITTNEGKGIVIPTSTEGGKEPIVTKSEEKPISTGEPAKVETFEQFEKCIAFGVDGIISDDVRLLHEYLQR